jgi:rod shape-determining protein MreC
MAGKKSARRFLFGVGSVLLLFLSVGLTRGDQGEVAGPEAWVKTGVARLQGWLTAPVQAAMESADAKNMGRNSAEVLRLKARVNELERENQELKQLLGYRDEKGIQYIPARVVFRSPDRWTNRVVINRGAKDGVLPKMPIITDQGLIGRVESVTDDMADIQLLTDAGKGPGIGATIQNGQDEITGIIEGYDETRKCLIMNKIPAGAKPKKGEIVVTSRLSDVFTGGILIGTVEEVKTGESGVDQQVWVKPAASFERLDYVMVVRDPSKLQLIRDGRQGEKGGTTR